MKIQEAIEAVKRMRYKHEAEIEALEVLDALERIRSLDVVVRMRVRDPEDDVAIVTRTATRRIYWETLELLSLEVFLLSIRELLDALEKSETSRWFRYDGYRVDDPERPRVEWRTGEDAAG